MNIIGFDMETRSDYSINHGTYKYLRSPHSAIVCMSYSINFGPPVLWLPKRDKPIDFNKFDSVYAFNIQFDSQVIDVLGKPLGFKPIELERQIDVMALCARFMFPQSLAWAGDVLKLRVGKDRLGKSLMKKICIPPFKYTREELISFFRYCMRDTKSMMEMIKALPASKLSPREQSYWEDTVKVNNNGLPIDTESVDRIHGTIKHYIEYRTEELKDITQGRVTTPGQVKRITSWCGSKGVDLPNLTKETVSKFLERDLPEPVRQVLELRKQLGRSSIAKYKALRNYAVDGRIYQNLRYYAAATGRYGGLGFQAHNLPRAKIKDQDAEIAKYFDMSILDEDPIGTASGLIRGMIKAPDGKILMVEDWSSIEYVLLSWATMDQEALSVFSNGLDQYVDMASEVYKKSYNDVTAHERQLGKTIILGCGYGLGAAGFETYAEGYGVSITATEAEYAVAAYRNKYNLVVRFWYKLKDKCIAAILSEGMEFEYKRCKFLVRKDRTGRRWLAITIPSGRTMYYPDPGILEDSYGPVPYHMGINSYTRKWSRLKLIPGRICENVIQALARDVLSNAVHNLLNENHKVIVHIHDEIVVETDKGGVTLAHPKMVDIMCTPPPWALDLPLRTTGFISDRFRKE